ncbi:MAG: pyridoxal phosphate-dependent aminotransferase [Planctomycetes bacterium]|nr:pyridoxal phosphate-dependent aminotransferase [Planctomycetota bacterium]
MDNPMAQRVSTLKQSDIRRFSAICAAMNGVNLSQGVCDQPAPDVVKTAAKQAIDDDHAIYTNLRGTTELRQAIARKMQHFNGIECDPQKEIVVTVGGAGSFTCAVLSTLNPGDECIVFSPFYSYHVNLLRLFGVEVKFVDLTPPNWTYDQAALEAAFTERTRMILVCTPNNPTGKVYTESELTAIIELANRYNAWIVTDEIYEYITYGQPHISLARLGQARSRTLTINGASKTFAVTGWRIGYTVGPAEIMERIAVVNDLLYICAPAPLQYGVQAGLDLPDSYYEKMRADYLAKRELLVDTLKEVGFTPFVPEGSYYLLASFEEGRWPNATAATEAILNEVGVATVPGSAFYRTPSDGENQLRFCYAKQMADLQEACRRLRKLKSAKPAVTESKVG